MKCIIVALFEVIYIQNNIFIIRFIRILTRGRVDSRLAQSQNGPVSVINGDLKMLHVALVDTAASVGYTFKKFKDLGVTVTNVYTYGLDYTSVFGKKIFLPDLADHVVIVQRS